MVCGLCENPNRCANVSGLQGGANLQHVHHMIGCRRPWHGLRCCRHKKCVSSVSRRIRTVSDHACIHVTAWPHLCDIAVMAIISNGTCILHCILIPALLHHLPYRDSESSISLDAVGQGKTKKSAAKQTGQKRQLCADASQEASASEQPSKRSRNDAAEPSAQTAPSAAAQSGPDVAAPMQTDSTAAPTTSTETPAPAPGTEHRDVII